jgi:hypothetical protein
MRSRIIPSVPRRIQLGLLSAVAAIGVVTAFAVSSSQASPATSVKPARLTVGVQVLKMTPAAGRTLRGVGLVTATLTNNTGQTRTTHSRVAFTAAAGKSCQILNLTLNQLHLSLLGLNVDLAKVVLTITGIKQGHPGGGILGSLFCSLASTKLTKAQRAGAARQLTSDLQRRTNQRVLRFGVNLRPNATTAAAGATCPVLDLILGPLHLDLLGLVVDLNKVHLTVTATQGGGVLGNLFCSLSTATVPVPTTPTG